MGYFIDAIRNADLEYIPIYFLLGSGALAWALIVGLAVKLWIDSVQRNRLIANLRVQRWGRISEADRNILRATWPLETKVLDEEMAQTAKALDREFSGWRVEAEQRA